LEGKRILITGAGGSIGSSLVEAALSLDAEHVVALDQSEFGLHELLLQLNPQSSKRVTPQLGATHDTALLDQIMKTGIDTVIHAAAHKYVPLLEENARAALINNVEGTIAPAVCSARTEGVHFVCVSSDKAAEPKNVLGQSKRLAELTISASHASRSSSSFTCVRLPNVLGSNGSVVPLFFEQAQTGGPLTVTDPLASRYFISEREAVHQIIDCAIHPALGSIVVPETRAPISIQQMARAIALKWGLEESDITHAEQRPGDCRHEKLIASGEAESIDSHGRRCVELPQLDESFLQSALAITAEARLRDDRWAKEQLQALLVRYDSLQDVIVPPHPEPGGQEALNYS
jgi:FlaA1/EpsC-like NDP-sugar epimerase